MSCTSKHILKWGMVVTAVVLVLSTFLVISASAREVIPPEPIPIDPGNQVAGDNDGVAGIAGSYKIAPEGSSLFSVPAIGETTSQVSDSRAPEYFVFTIMLQQLQWCLR